MRSVTGILHNTDEQHPTKVKSIPMVCPNCGKEDCPGCLPKIPTKGIVEKNIKERFDYIHRSNPHVVAQLPKKLLFTTEDGIKVFAVDDNFVKVNLDDDWTEGGNWEAYPSFVPKGEVWVASDKSPENIKGIITHELTEVRLMQMDKMKYDKAHVIANRVEMNQRVKDNPGLLKRVPKEKKGAKVGNPKLYNYADSAYKANVASMQEGGKLTKLDSGQEKTFQSWYKRTSTALGLDPDPDSYQHYYDYRGFYKEYGDVPMKNGQHFTDTYKLPGHPTFSNESKYANFSNRDKQGYWATMETGKGQDNFVKLSDKKLPIKRTGGLLKQN